MHVAIESLLIRSGRSISVDQGGEKGILKMGRRSYQMVAPF